MKSGTFFTFKNTSAMCVFVMCVLCLADGKYKRTAECNCGYGGLCVRNETGILQEPDCAVCKKVSEGFYDSSDCHTIVNHCSHNPCQSGGSCVPIFGSYFCRCPAGRTGQRCDLRESDLGKEFKEYGVSNEYYVYYQIQTLETGEKSSFHFIYDPGDQKELQKKEERGVKVIVAVDDGRVYFPMKRFGDLDRKDYRQMCVEEARNHPQLWDKEVCKYVPKGERWGFEIGTKTYQDPNKYIEDNITYYAKERVAGYRTQLYITVLWVDEEKRETHAVLFSDTFKIFRYTASKVKNYCFTYIEFDGCSQDSFKPDIFLRGNPILISTIIKEEHHETCRGILYPKQSWYLMRGRSVDGTYDTRPKNVYGADDHKYIHFPPRSFNDGIQAITIRLLLQGDPPHYGGQTTYSVYGRCWIKIEMGPVNVQALGGSTVTASCYNPLKLDLISLNPGITVIEMVYIYKCNLTGDPECDRTKVTDVPAIRKLQTPCDTTIRFDVTARHEQDEDLNQNLTVIVHFIRSQIQLSIDCLYNCFPIDRRERTVVVATTIPYTSGTIEWNVTFKGKEIKHYEANVDTFYPLVSTRIARFDGNLIESDGFSTTKVEISSRLSNTPLEVTVDTKSSDLEHIVNKFKYEVTQVPEIDPPINAFRFFLGGNDTIYHEFQPLTYSLVQMSEKFQDSLMVGPFKYYTELGDLVGIANWPDVQLCVRDAMNVHSCSRTHQFEAKPFAVSLEYMRVLHRTNDIAAFVTVAVFWFTQGFVDNEHHPGAISWNYTLQERALVLGWLKTFTDLREQYVRAILSVLTFSFYSHQGNNMLFLIIFWEEFVEYSEVKSGSFVDEIQFHRWVNYRQDAVNLLYDVTKWVKSQTDASGGQINFVNHMYGDVLDGVVRCLNLADIQGSFVLRFMDDVKFSVYKDLMVAELEIKARQSVLKMRQITYTAMAAISTMTRLYYGIRFYGNAPKYSIHEWNHIIIYALRNSYQGILCSLNRSRPVVEDIDKHMNYIFEREEIEQDEWLDYMSLTMPSATDLPSLQDKELRFSVYVGKNVVGDHSISPTLYIDMRNVAGERYKSLPDGGNYTVTFPVMLGGKLTSMSSTELWSDVLITPENPDDDYKYFSVYKIVFPNAFEIWELHVFTDEPVPIKISINLENLPQIDDVDEEPAKTGTYHARSGTYRIMYAVQASDFPEYRSCNKPASCSKTLPLYFYFGMLLTNSTPVETPVTFSIKDTVDVCDVQEPTYTMNPQPCAGIQKGEFNTIDCQCELFGFVVATVKYVRINRVYAVDIGLVIPNTIATVQIFLPLFMVCFVLVVLVYALWLDWRRRRMDALIYLDDCHPLDKYVYVLGVYTGNSIMAGTRAVVAMKIIGLSSSSRVHLLRSPQRKLLQSATDDWFVITTKQPLGKIASVMMWHNHRCLSDWYCNHILIFDMKQENWYFVNVERWFKLYPVLEDSEMAQLKAFKFGNMESALKAMPHQFRSNYIVETRNTHHFFSLFFLHMRSLASNEHRACIFLIKFFAMWFWVWFVEDVEYKHKLRSIDEPNIDEIYIDIDVAIKVSQVVLGSYLFTTPYYLLIRSTQMSGLIQKKTTNPINIEVIRQELKTVRSEQEEKALKEKNADHLEKQQKSVLFQLESIDRTDSAQSWIARPGEDDHGKHQRSGPKKHWSATHYQMPRWKKFVIMALGPSQFRCVNVKHQLFEVKMAKRLLIARLLAGFLILLALALVIVLEELTSYWRKSYVSIFEFSVSFLADVLIINPLLILINSVIIFLCLKTSNRELMFWSENTPISEVKPKTFKTYIETVTKKEYKPLRSSEIRRYEYIQLAYSSVRMIFIYAYLGFCLFVIAMILSNRYDVGYHYNVRSILTAATITSKYEVRPTLSLDEVIDIEEVQYFLPSTFGDLKFLWPNSKPMSRNGSRWFLDRTSKPFGSASIMITCISDKVKMRIPKVFVPYFHRALGFIDQSEILKKPIVLADREVYYTSNISDERVYGELQSSSYRIQMYLGASDEDYGLSGHRATLPMKNWIKYYIAMVTYVEDFINNPDIIPRVMVLTMNTVNVFTHRVITCDVIVEILPSGVTSARLQISSVKNSPVRRWTFFMRYFLVFLTLCFTWLTVVDVSKIGFRDFVDSWYGTMKIALLVTGTLMMVSTLAFSFPKYSELDKFADYPFDKYKDIHHVHARETIDSIILAVFLLTMCADIAVAIREAFGKRLQVLSRASTQGFRLAFTMLLWILILSRAAESAVGLYGLNRWFFLISFYCKSMFPLETNIDVTTATEVYIIGGLMLLILTSKFCTALFIHKFEECETYFRMRRTKPQQAQSVSILKYTAYRKHTVTDVSLLFLSKRRSSPRQKTPSPESPEPEPVRLAPNLDSRLSKLSKRFFGLGLSDSLEPTYRQSPRKSKDRETKEPL